MLPCDGAAIAVDHGFARQLFGWAHEPALLAAAGFVSLVLVVLGVLGVPWLIVRLPADYFAGPGPPSRFVRRGLALVAIKNAAGALLLVLGLAMLILPGQGILTILVAIGLLDFPGKWRLERRLISIGPVLSVFNRIRSRAGRPPLVIQGTDV